MAGNRGRRPSSSTAAACRDASSPVGVLTAGQSATAKRGPAPSKAPAETLISSTDASKSVHLAASRSCIDSLTTVFDEAGCVLARLRHAQQGAQPPSKSGKAGQGDASTRSQQDKALSDLQTQLEAAQQGQAALKIELELLKVRLGRIRPGEGRRRNAEQVGSAGERFTAATSLTCRGRAVYREGAYACHAIPFRPQAASEASRVQLERCMLGKEQQAAETEAELDSLRCERQRLLLHHEEAEAQRLQALAKVGPRD